MMNNFITNNQNLVIDMKFLRAQYYLIISSHSSKYETSAVAMGIVSLGELAMEYQIDLLTLAAPERAVGDGDNVQQSSRK